MEYKLGRSITKLFLPSVIPPYVDKSPAEGLVVALRGDTFIKCKKNQKPSGVYTAGSFRRVMLFNGEKMGIAIPEGIIFYGQAQVKKGD